ncbi:hypothetical protein ANCCAN_24347 [Ancylostoma caninum]|uniref:Uncharacterized protein n=1 Tax=Ancylostoma caninum TaxID=29170 RepID=A0A368FI84_ANCCA|nr:hypothetical protein ANCCAN_24347 [Ancylostoma caninum]
MIRREAEYRSPKKPFFFADPSEFEPVVAEAAATTISPQLIIPPASIKNQVGSSPSTSSEAVDRKITSEHVVQVPENKNPSEQDPLLPVDLTQKVPKVPLDIIASHVVREEKGSHNNEAASSPSTTETPALPLTATETSSPLPPLTATENTSPPPLTATGNVPPLPSTATETSPPPMTATGDVPPLPSTVTETSSPPPLTATDITPPLPSTATEASSPPPSTATGNVPPLPPAATETSSPSPSTATEAPSLPSTATETTDASSGQPIVPVDTADKIVQVFLYSIRNLMNTTSLV